MWLSSRGIIWLVMLGIAPLISGSSEVITVKAGWEVFSAWDSNFYEQIATSGYEILENNAPGANVAFFPFYPLLIRLLMTVGLSAVTAGTLINHIAFLVTLIILYDWVDLNQGQKVAKWTTATLAFCPLSLFGSVVYTEGIFLLFSTLALSAFDRGYYWRSALWGSFATATRITGLALIPAMLLTAIFKRLSIKAYLASFLTSIGVMAYGVYCWMTFNDPKAFITVQYTQWDKKTGIDLTNWGRMLVEITAGAKNWNQGTLVDLVHPLIFGSICLIAFLLWYFRGKLGRAKVDYGFFSLFVLLWLLAGDPLLNTLSIVGGVYLLWRLRRDLPLIAVSYGFCSLGILIASGGTASLNRYAYGIISLTMGLGVVFTRFPRWGYAMMGFFTLLLITLSLRFAQQLWVA